MSAQIILSGDGIKVKSDNETAYRLRRVMHEAAEEWCRMFPFKKIEGGGMGFRIELADDNDGEMGPVEEEDE